MAAAGRSGMTGPRALYAALASRNLTVPVFLAIWTVVVVVPLLVMVAFSFLQIRNYQVVYQPTLAAWTSLIDSGRWISAVRTLRVAFTVTAIELLLAFPFALWLAKGCRSKGFKAAIITLLTIPFFIDASSRIIVWRAILGTNGIINTMLMQIGLIDEPMTWMLFSEFAVHFGMIGSYFPSMVLPIYLILVLIDDSYLQASADLGASPVQTLTQVVIPLAMPGIIAGIVFTLVPLMAAFIEPQMLGGGFVNLLGASVEAALSELKYPTAAALSTVVVVLLFLLLVLLIAITRKRFDVGTIFQAMKQ